MGCDTCGKIKGYVKSEDIFEFVKQKYDKDATNQVTRKTSCPLSKCDWTYKINKHSDDYVNWYNISGFICFTYNNENRLLFYSYDNLNHYENLEYYTKFGLEDMVKSETTYVSLGCWGSSVEIIKEIIENFGGGWIDENDCDDNVYYLVEAKQHVEEKEKMYYAGVDMTDWDLSYKEDNPKFIYKAFIAICNFAEEFSGCAGCPLRDKLCFSKNGNKFWDMVHEELADVEMR